MAYGDYNGPNKPDKGREGGSCNRMKFHFTTDKITIYSDG